MNANKYAICLQHTKTMSKVIIIVSGTSTENAKNNLETKSDYLDEYIILSIHLVIDEIY